MSTIRPRSPRSYALAAPAILWMLGALVVPTLLIVWVSFWATRAFSMSNPLGLVNYAKFFSRAAYVKLVVDTVQQALLIMVVTLPLAYAIAYFQNSSTPCPITLSVP